MTTIEGGNGQNVHEGEDDTEEGSHLPEYKPVPISREEITNRTETTE